MDCVKLYQPAAAAEARLRGGPADGQPHVAQVTPPVAAPAGEAAAQKRGREANPSASDASLGASRDGAQPQSAARLSAAAKDLIRAILEEEQRERTQELVDSAWQSLE